LKKFFRGTVILRVLVQDVLSGGSSYVRLGRGACW